MSHATSAHSRSPGVTRAAIIDAFGGPGQFHVQQLPLAAPGPGQVRIKVAAAAVNPVDTTTRAGRNIPEKDARFPMVLGWDVAGTVERAGEGAGGWQVGDRVAAMTFQPLDQNGTYTEYINLTADLVARVPDKLSLVQASTIPLAGLTAAQLVKTLALPAGATLLVNGPAGAMGRLVAQIASRSGIKVIGIAKPDQRDAVLGYGASDVIDRGQFTGLPRTSPADGVDGAIDLVGGRTARFTLDSVRDGGVYVTSVPPYIDPSGPFDSERGIGVEVLVVHTDSAQLAELLDSASRGELTTAVERAYPLSEAPEAHRRQQQGDLYGKLVLVP